MKRTPRRGLGFTLLELTAALAILGVLFGVFLERLTYYGEAAERASVDMQVRSFKMGLQVRLAELMLTNRQGEATRLEVENPTIWLSEPPPNYGGTYHAGVASGGWYFDAGSSELVYVVNNGRNLDVDAENGRKLLKFRVKLVYDPIVVGAATIKSISGVALVPVHPYRWS